VPKIVGFLGGFPGNFWGGFRQLLCWFCVSDLATLKPEAPFVFVVVCNVSRMCNFYLVRLRSLS